MVSLGSLTLGVGAGGRVLRVPAMLISLAADIGFSPAATMPSILMWNKFPYKDLLGLSHQLGHPHQPQEFIFSIQCLNNFQFLKLIPSCFKARVWGFQLG